MGVNRLISVSFGADITTETADLLEIVSQVNEKIQMLATSAKDISSSTETLADTMEKVGDEVENLANRG